MLVSKKDLELLLGLENEPACAVSLEAVVNTAKEVNRLSKRCDRLEALLAETTEALHHASQASFKVSEINLKLAGCKRKQ